jgi:GNAT superfamily N-acetyltransferase
MHTSSIAGAEMTTVGALYPENSRRALETLTRAFSEDPPCRWLFPDEMRYRRYFPMFAEAFGGKAITQGTALADRDISGVALWLPPGTGPNEAALACLIEQSVPKRRLADVFALFARMARVHPREPHWYLPLIGVEPEQQGRGLGTALLSPVLDACDAAQLPAYLEATTARSVPLYRRHGFEPIGEICVGSSPPIVAMRRWPVRSTMN